MKVLTYFSSVLALSLAMAAPALAATSTFNFSFAGTGANGSGTLTASTTSVAGQYLITGVTGTVNGSNITALLAPNTFPTNYTPANDNLFFTPGAAFLDDAGFSFSDAAGIDFNLFYGANQRFNGVNSYQFADGARSATAGGSLTSFTATPAVTPEPGSLALVGTGLLASVGVLRRRFVS